VTSSDREGNFYRSIIVEDESGGAEIKLGIFNSASQYPVGLVIALRLKGCAAMFDNGVMQIGLPPQEHDALPLELAAQLLIDKHIVRSNTIDEGEPTTYNIASLDGSACGRFVRVENLRHTPLAEDAECTSIVGYHRFTDNDGNAIFTSVSDYADFAASELPSSAVTLQGILYYETVGLGIGKQFVIKPRFADDISISDSTF
jgi:hypothetical protein